MPADEARREAGRTTGPETDAVAHPLHPLPPVGRTFVAGFESTYHPDAGIDALDTTGHSLHWERDLADMTAAGVRHLRYPLRWQRIQQVAGRLRLGRDRPGARAAARARRHPWLPAYTLFNEPFATLFLGGHEGRCSRAAPDVPTPSGCTP